jgi:hypothetical protein
MTFFHAAKEHPELTKWHNRKAHPKKIIGRKNYKRISFLGNNLQAAHPEA